MASADALISLQQRIESGELIHLMNLETDVQPFSDPDRTWTTNQVMQNLVTLYGEKAVISDLPFNGETRTVHSSTNLFGVYVTDVAYHTASSS